jgi:hypothetical protein
MFCNQIRYDTVKKYLRHVDTQDSCSKILNKKRIFGGMFNNYYQTRYRSLPGAGRKREIQVKGRKNI